MCSSIVYILSVDRFNSEQDRSLLRFLTETAVPLLAVEARLLATGASAGDDPFDFSASVDEDEAAQQQPSSSAAAAALSAAAAAAATRERLQTPTPEQLQAAGRLQQLLAHEARFAEFCNLYDSIEHITVRVISIIIVVCLCRSRTVLSLLSFIHLNSTVVNFRYNLYLCALSTVQYSTVLVYPCEVCTILYTLYSNVQYFLCISHLGT